jgi:hypothetical protein
VWKNPPSLSIATEKVCFISIKARQFDVKDVVTDPWKPRSLGHGRFAMTETSVISGNGRITMPTKWHWKGCFAISR